MSAAKHSPDSEESNDMIMNSPDIESIENIRKRKKAEKEIKQLEKALRQEEKEQQKNGKHPPDSAKSNDMIVSNPDIDSNENVRKRKKAEKEIKQLEKALRQEEKEQQKNGKRKHPPDSAKSNDMIVSNPDIESIENINKREKALKQDEKEQQKNGKHPSESEKSKDVIVSNPNVESIENAKKRKREEKELFKALKQVEKEQKETEHLRKIEERRQHRIHVEQELIRMRQERQQQKLEFEAQKREEREERRQKKLEEEKRLRQLREERKAKALEEKKALEDTAIQERKTKALKGMKYLLNISEKYSDFFREKLVPEKESLAKPLQERNILQPTVSDMKEAAIVEPEKSARSAESDVMKKMKYFEGGELRQYQIDGVQWMNTLFENGINGILADEMGLGKTIQVIALICHFMQRKVPGPYLVVAPLSTIPNWDMEFKRFAPKVPVVVFHGSEADRIEQYSLLNKKYKIGNHETYPVVLTTYQVPLLEAKFLNQKKWQYVIIDEGHRVKNHEAKLSMILRSLNSSNRLLLTGTPIHNNITELWALLNFLMPHIFKNVDTFASLLMLEDMQDENKLIEQEMKTNLLSTLHRVMEPFVLRRIKKEVLGDLVPKKEVNIFCPLSRLQRYLYSYVIDKNIEGLRKAIKEEEEGPEVLLGPRKARKAKTYYVDSGSDDFSDYEERVLEEQETVLASQKIEKEQMKMIVRLTMQSPMMMYKKIVDHPYLVHFPLDPDAPKKSLLINEDLISNSGKMIVLDQILKRLKDNGHKVLLFSTLVMCLDLIEEMFIMRGYKYCRLDGSHDLESRKDSIESFNKDPDVLAFLLSTRAGGLGLNLTGADTVIFFDRDWNPQVDIQAQDRCHRIGQTRPVMVFTLITKGTIDETVIETGYKKRLLEKVVIKDGKFQKQIGKKPESQKLESELLDLKRLLEEENNHFRDLAVVVQEIDTLLDRSELYAQVGMKYKMIKKEIITSLSDLYANMDMEYKPLTSEEKDAKSESALSDDEEDGTDQKSKLRNSATKRFKQLSN